MADYALGVERTYTMPVRDGVFIDDGRSVGLARVGNVILAFSLQCPHRGKLLEWLPGEQRCFCPKHKARFTATGAHSSGRRTTDLDHFALRARRAA